jgi:hypothetical protein
VIRGLDAQQAAKTLATRLGVLHKVSVAAWLRAQYGCVWVFQRGARGIARDLLWINRRRGQ